MYSDSSAGRLLGAPQSPEGKTECCTLVRAVSTGLTGWSKGGNRGQGKVKSLFSTKGKGRFESQVPVKHTLKYPWVTFQSKLFGEVWNRCCVMCGL